MIGFKNSVLSNVKTRADGEVFEESDFAKSSYKSIFFKVVFFLAVTILSGFSWFFIPVDILYPILVFSSIGVFLALIINIFAPRVIPTSVLGVIYGLSEGLMLGAVLIVLNEVPEFQNIGTLAVLSTLVIFAVTLLLYLSNIVRATNKLRKILFIFLISTFIISIFYGIFSIVLEIEIDFLEIGICIAYILIGTIMLVIQFDQAESIVLGNAPKKYEWEVAFGLFVAILYIFVNLLRLLIILANKKK
ncbi:MAG: Bax inhibitor-1/YccA family protein [Acholeplasmatales bacterium]|jgi:uncharacterized YccA/Bax inhibitor family protein|nr:Bax inhibitor-1/YccA family protein [Acholeplasmatales bacterium]